MTEPFSMMAIDQGSVMLFSHHESGGEMWTGTGPRALRSRVTFGAEFLHPPVVHVSMGLIDVETSANLRTDIAAEGVDREGFSIVFRTWGDSRVARIRADWLALGPGEDPEIWKVD